jgi:hypothetical protein
MFNLYGQEFAQCDQGFPKSIWASVFAKSGLELEDLFHLYEHKRLLLVCLKIW